MSLSAVTVWGPTMGEMTLPHLSRGVTLYCYWAPLEPPPMTCSPDFGPASKTQPHYPWLSALPARSHSLLRGSEAYPYLTCITPRSASRLKTAGELKIALAETSRRSMRERCTSIIDSNTDKPGLRAGVYPVPTSNQVIIKSYVIESRKFAKRVILHGIKFW